MTPHRDSRHTTPGDKKSKTVVAGSFVLDRVFRSVGRIKLASGTGHAPTFKLVNAMLTGLFARGRLDLLEAIRDRVLTPLQVWDAYRMNELERLPTAAMLVPLVSAFTGWRERSTASARHRESRSQSGRYLAQFARADARVAQLPVILLDARRAMEAKGHAVTFNRLKSAVQAFVRDTMGKASPLYRDVQGVPRLTEVTQVMRRPQTVPQLAALATKFDEATRAAAWSMATTGMGPAEYWGAWERRVGYIHIAGTKREGRVRDVPDLGRCTPPALSRQAFEDRLVKAEAPITPYDLRRTFANWLEAAHIPRTRRILYLGHRATDVTALYEQHEVLAFLAADGEKLQSYIAAELASGNTLRIMREAN